MHAPRLSAATPAALAQGIPQPPRERRALNFSIGTLVLCIVAQRFGLPLAGSTFSIVGPLGLALAGYGLASGALSFHRARSLIYLVFVCLTLAGMAVHAAVHGPFGSGTNLASLSQFVALTAFATLTFAEPVGEAAFFRVVTLALVLVAAAGILQFCAQFAGLRLFAFSGLLPDSILVESGWNLSIPSGVGDLLKANGLVLVEPSVFSQFTAIGLILEAMISRRPLYLAIFVVGLLLSFSGTGWIVLAAFLVGSAIGLGWRGLLIALGVAALLAMALGLAAVLAPDFMAAISVRAQEIDHPGTSAHLRFITPFWMYHDVVTGDPSALLWGVGSGESERLTLSYDYDVNSLIKVAAEYGIPAVLAYLSLFVVGRKTAIQWGLLLPVMILFLFTGGYQQFPPVLFFVLLLITVARLRPIDQPGVAATDAVSRSPVTRAAAAAR